MLLQYRFSTGHIWASLRGRCHSSWNGRDNDAIHALFLQQEGEVRVGWNRNAIRQTRVLQRITKTSKPKAVLPIQLKWAQFSVFDDRVTCDVFHANPDGLQQPVIKQMEGIYGANLIEIVVLPVYKLIINEVLIFDHNLMKIWIISYFPWNCHFIYFFRFPIHSIYSNFTRWPFGWRRNISTIRAKWWFWRQSPSEWVFGKRGKYCNINFLSSSSSIFITDLAHSLQQMTALREKVQVTGTITVLRGGTGEIIWKIWNPYFEFEIVIQQLSSHAEYHVLTTELVPGDVICINPSKIQEIQCDAVLIEGSCSIDESMLTGESYPITKVPLLFINTTWPKLNRNTYADGSS